MESIFRAVRMTCLITLVWAAVAHAQYNPNSTVTTGHNSQAAVMICPQGDGDPLSEAWTCISVPPYRMQVDATITLTLIDNNNVEVVGKPAEDIWLEVNGVCFCFNGSIADSSTNDVGVTTFSGPLYGGGCSQDNSTRVLVDGIVINSAPLLIWYNSPDMNCDGIVNLTDASLFISCYLPPGYEFCCDLNNDCMKGLSDVVAFVIHYGHECP